MLTTNTLAILYRQLIHISLACVCISVIPSNSSSAEVTPTFQSLESIRITGQEFIRTSVLNQLGITETQTPQTTSAPANPARVEIFATAGELDSRLRFPKCAGALQAFTLNQPAIASRNTVGVRCSSGSDWTVYLQVSVESMMDALVLKRPISRDDQLTPSDVEIQRRRVPGFGGQYLSQVAQLSDYKVKRSVPAGTVVSTDILHRNAVIRRGQQVTLITTLAGIDVRANGIALADAGNADRIRVQNTSSLKIVEGRVETSNTVRVGM
jgi:flagellar basal body P-ring formation protein FlgA